MSEKYTEIFKLKEKLDAIDLEYEFNDFGNKELNYERYQIALLDEEGKRIVTVVQGNYSYSGVNNKLEIMGLLTAEEEEHDSVVGWLTADEVYERIMNYYASREEF